VALDYLVAVVCLPLLGLSLHQVVDQDTDNGYSLIQLALLGLLTVVLVLPMALRRRNPLAALILGTCAVVVVPLLTVIAWSVMGVQSVPGPVAGLLPPLAERNPWLTLGVDLALVCFLPLAYVIYLVAAGYRRMVAAGALAGLLVLLVFCVLLSRGPKSGSAFLDGFLIIISWVVGYTAGQRRAYAAQLQDQAASSAVTEERLRIARELHDVVAHSMTVIAVQAGFGHHVIDEQPARAREALGAIQATSREALTEMRRMLGVLRQADAPSGAVGKTNVAEAAGTSVEVAAAGRGRDIVPGLVPARGGAPGETAGTAASPVSAGTGSGTQPGGHRLGSDAAPLAPAPGLADLDRLVARIAQAGVTVSLRVEGNRRDLPAGINLAAFRIVQESLTNVVKHAGTDACQVTIAFGEDELSVEITDEGRGCPVPATAGAPGVAAPEPPGGHGLIGMRERVALYRGELSAGPQPGRGFRVAVRLPTGDGGAS